MQWRLLQDKSYKKQSGFPYVCSLWRMRYTSEVLYCVLLVKVQASACGMNFPIFLVLLGKGVQVLSRFLVCTR